MRSYIQLYLCKNCPNCSFGFSTSHNSKRKQHTPWYSFKRLSKNLEIWLFFPKSRSEWRKRNFGGIDRIVVFVRHCRVWQNRGSIFEVYISHLVVQESGKGEKDAASERLQVLKDFQVLELRPEALELSQFS